VLLGRLMADGGHVVWIGPRNELFGPGLAELGLAPARLIVVRARPAAARLWALEEALRSPGLAAALAEVEQLSLTQSRRLQLAAEAKGVTALLLRPPGAGATPAAGGSRQVSGRPHWRIGLCRCRGGRTGSWRVAWHEDGWHEIPDALALAAGPGDRPAAAVGPARRRRA
jgi:protein ImuA